jgi:hypothetical protein
VVVVGCGSELVVIVETVVEVVVDTMVVVGGDVVAVSALAAPQAASTMPNTAMRAILEVTQSSVPTI